MNIFVKTLCFFCLPLFLNVEKAVSAVYVYPMEVSVSNNKGSNLLKVVSQDNDVKFIKVSIKKILQPGTPQENEKAVESSDTTDLIITPQKIALSPSSERVVRVISLNPPEKETTWRVYFESVNDDNFIQQQFDNGKKTAAASIGVNVVWGALIHVAPINAKVSLNITRKGGKILNNGTIRVQIKELGICENSDKCQWKKLAATIYPDTETRLDGITFNKDTLYRIKYFNWVTEKNEEISLSQENDY